MDHNEQHYRQVFRSLRDFSGFAGCCLDERTGIFLAIKTRPKDISLKSLRDCALVDTSAGQALGRGDLDYFMK
eukprot:7189848-Pyramimonas_sp.AAC.1